MSEHLQPVTDSAFDTEVLQSSTPVLLDFWAEWCGPCRMLTPILEEMAKEYAGKVVFMKMNVDENNLTPAKYGVRGIPTLIIFKNGKVAATKAGYMTKTQLTAFLDSHI